MNKDARLLTDHEVRRRLEFVDFDAMIPRKIIPCKFHGAVQLRTSGDRLHQYDSLTEPFQKHDNSNGQKLPVLSRSSNSGTRLLRLAYVGNSPPKSVKRREKGSNCANGTLVHDSIRDLFDVSNSARRLITTVLDEVLQMSVDEVVWLDHDSDNKTVTPDCALDDNAEISNSARDWTGELINNVMQNALMDSRYAVHGESSLGNQSVHLGSDECDHMTASAREAVVSFVHDTLCFCVEDTQNYLDLEDTGNSKVLQPSSSYNPMQNQLEEGCVEALDAEHEKLPTIADAKVQKVLRLSTAEKPPDSSKAFLDSVQDNLDSLRSILYRGNRDGAKIGETEFVIKCPSAQLELNSIIPSWIGRDGPIIRRNPPFHGQKSSDVNARNRAFPALKSGKTRVQMDKQSSMPASRSVHYRPSNLLTQSVCRAATIHLVTDQNRYHDLRRATKSNEVGCIDRNRNPQIPRADALVRSLPKVTTLSDNRKILNFNGRGTK